MISVKCAHAIKLSLSLSHTHTHTHIYIHTPITYSSQPDLDALGFKANVRERGLALLLRNRDNVPLGFTLEGQTASLGLWFEFVAESLPASYVESGCLSASARVTLTDSSGKALANVAQGAVSDSRVCNDGKVVVAAARVYNLTGTFSLQHILLEVLTPFASLGQCPHGMVAVSNGTCVPAAQDPNALRYVSAYPRRDLALLQAASANITLAKTLVTVADRDPPVFAGCPANMTVTAASGSVLASASWLEPTVADNVRVATQAISFAHDGGTYLRDASTWVGGALTSALFPARQKVVKYTYTATDAAGNQASCT